MPLTLWWYILREMLKPLTAATVILVCLLSFGAALKPISDGLIGPGPLAMVVLYTMPGMLMFALPFAAAFAGTLVFFRMSTENEIGACAAGGLSYRDLLAPVLVLGLVLTLGVFLLSNWVVPGFWRMAEQEVKQDVARLLVQQLRRGEAVSMGRLIIYADDASERPVTERRATGQPSPYARVVLDGVAVGLLAGGGGSLAADYTAERAVVDLYRDERAHRIFATMMLWRVTINDPDSGMMASVERQPVEAQEIPSPFQYDPKFMSLAELRELANNPQLSGAVANLRQQLVEALATQRLLGLMHARLDGDGPDGEGGTLELTNPGGRRYTIHSPRSVVDGGRLRLETDGERRVGVAVDPGAIALAAAGGEGEAGVGRAGRQRIEALGGRLDVAVDELTPEPRVNLVLNTAEVLDPTLPGARGLRELTVPRLHFDEPVLGPLREASLDRLLVLADAEGDTSDDIDRTRMALADRIERVRRDIHSRLHERAATSVNCVLVLLLGAVMSMRLRLRQPLTIFFWCFVPMVIAFLAISSGKNMIQWAEMPLGFGVAMAWAGNGALALLVLGVYLRLRRN